MGLRATLGTAMMKSAGDISPYGLPPRQGAVHLNVLTV